jgi:hypothetical protein
VSGYPATAYTITFEPGVPVANTTRVTLRVTEQGGAIAFSFVTIFSQ